MPTTPTYPRPIPVPPLVFADVPPEAQSLALIVDDPDTKHGTFTHWIVFDLDPQTTGLAENRRVTAGREGNNDRRERGYCGPLPPDGEHHYFFRLLALDRKLGLPEGISRTDFDRATAGHVLTGARLMGRFAPPVQAQRDGL